VLIKSILSFCLSFSLIFSPLIYAEDVPVYVITSPVKTPGPGEFNYIPIPGNIETQIDNIPNGNDFIIRDGNSGQDHHFTKGGSTDIGYPSASYNGTSETPNGSNSGKTNSDQGSREVGAGRSSDGDSGSGSGGNSAYVGVGADIAGANRLDQLMAARENEENFIKNLTLNIKNILFPNVGDGFFGMGKESVSGLGNGEGMGSSTLPGNDSDCDTTKSFSTSSTYGVPEITLILDCFGLSAGIPRFVDDSEILSIYFAMTKHDPDIFDSKDFRDDFNKVIWGVYDRIERPYYNNIIRKHRDMTDNFIMTELDKALATEDFILEDGQSQNEDSTEGNNGSTGYDDCFLNLNPYKCLHRNNNNFEIVKDDSFREELVSTQNKLTDAGRLDNPYRESLRQEALVQIDNIDEILKEEGESEELKDYFEKIVKPMADVALSLSPLAVVKDSYEALTGKNLLDGSDLSTNDRAFAIVGMVTVGFGSKIGKGLKWSGKLFSKTKAGEKAFKYAGEVWDTAQRIGGTGKEKISDLFGLFKKAEIKDVNSFLQTAKRTDDGVPIIFKSEEAVSHFNTHSGELMTVFGKSSYNLKEYMLDAHNVMKTGEYSSSMNGFVKLIGGEGKAKAAFVGVTRDGRSITTFHVKEVKDIARKAPELGWSK
jgi:hypothetical protein